METTTLRFGDQIRIKETGDILTVENYSPRMHPSITTVESDCMFSLDEVEIVTPAPAPRIEASLRFFKVGPDSDGAFLLEFVERDADGNETTGNVGVIDGGRLSKNERFVDLIIEAINR